ncbi:alpha/beta hydrolase [Arthrobacter sp. ISL-69]|nr:alpha/beta hydrolase [Arthrobacter sp. ISL-69]
MLDDRNETVSSYRLMASGCGTVPATTPVGMPCSATGRKTPEVSVYAAPARATDLSGLPPAFIDVATAEVFRDEVAAYASGIWAVGGVAELHVWAGGFHGFDMIVPQAALSIHARDVRTKWVRRILGA